MFWYISNSVRDWADSEDLLNIKNMVNEIKAVNILEAKTTIDKDKKEDEENWSYLLIPATSAPIQIVK